MMDEACNLRLQKLEIEQEAHKSQLMDRRRNERKLWFALNQINKSITQVKYAVFGGVFVIVAQNIGFFNAIKALF